jgi:hypothetical protein
MLERMVGALMEQAAPEQLVESVNIRYSHSARDSSVR